MAAIIQLHYMTDKNFWEDRYRQKHTGWDAGEITTPLKEYLQQVKDRSISVLIPGCGNAPEAEWLIANGFTNVTLVEISELVVNELREKFSSIPTTDLKIFNHDFFALQGKYDLILEQTFLCALPPHCRIDYANKICELLNDHGKLVGVLFDRTFEGGPPFSGSIQEYNDLFKEKFEIIKLERCYNSIPPRKGTEAFVILRKKL